MIIFIIISCLDGLQRKLKMVKNMKPRHIDDVVPLLYLSTTELRIVTDKLIKEQHMVPNGNRIYYLSRKLKVIATWKCDIHLISFDSVYSF